jgi:hypothetical protein
MYSSKPCKLPIDHMIGDDDESGNDIFSDIINYRIAIKSQFNCFNFDQSHLSYFTIIFNINNKLNH